MFKKRLWSFAALLLTVALLMSACAAPAAEELTAAEPAAEESAAGAPTELKVGAVIGSTLEDAWASSWWNAWQRIADEQPRGLAITVDVTEGVWGQDAELALREYAETGNYDILWAHSSYSDQVKNLYQDYPDILWAVSGSGNEALGENAYWIYAHLHEPAYLLGIIGGMTTKTNTVGVVAGFPFDDVNGELNGFVDGALSVNPVIEARVTYIDSWYNPPKAKEAALAQIAAGADVIYAERQGPFAACQEEGLLCFGHFSDQYEQAPDVVVASSMVFWDPAAMYLLEEWWAHVTEGKPYDAPIEPVWFGMADGGTDISPLYAWEQDLPSEVVDAVTQAHEDIIDGKLIVPLKVNSLDMEIPSVAD